MKEGKRAEYYRKGKAKGSTSTSLYRFWRYAGRHTGTFLRIGPCPVDLCHVPWEKGKEVAHFMKDKQVGTR